MIDNMGLFKSLLPTFNYLFRCPNLLLFNGEDLTPYRAASKNIMAVIGRFGVLERCITYILYSLVNVVEMCLFGLSSAFIFRFIWFLTGEVSMKLH